MSGIDSFRQVFLRIRRLVLTSPIPHKTLQTNLKSKIQEAYSFLAFYFYNKTFLNWGIWDQKIYQEYINSNYDFSKLCPHQDVHSQLLVYYILRPILQQNFKPRIILEVGCGNGIGLKMAAQLVKSEHALGVDLTHALARNAHSNFYEKDKVHYIQGDAELLPLADSSVDLITNIESSHLYPQIELFFNEAARVLKPKGFFCYTDVLIDNKQQVNKLNQFLRTRPDLQLLLKEDITHKVQSSIYHRLIVREQHFGALCASLFGKDSNALAQETALLASTMGLFFLPWWKLWGKTTLLRPIIKAARKRSIGVKKLYFYYLIQKK